jgi:predicted nuclease of restriction endonuclease-like RecB superfamily
MLTGNLVLVRTSRDRVIPRYLDPANPYWLEMAESLLLIFREALSGGVTRGAIEAEVTALIGEGGGAATFVHRGLAKVLEDRAEFEVVADVPPDSLRTRVFSAAAALRRQLRERGPRQTFRPNVVLEQVAKEVGLSTEQVASALFADLKDENRILAFHDLSARALVDRYNVALAQAVLLRSVWVKVEVRGETPARYRQLFRWIKFRRLLYRVSGSAALGFHFQIDGPLSLFSATTRYGLQMALFLPALLQFRAFRLDAELRWGPRREPKSFHLESDDGLVSHLAPQGQYVPQEITAFLDRFRQGAPDWEVNESAELVTLPGNDLWVPDYRFHHRPTGRDVHVEVLGFWKRSSVERLLKLLPQMGQTRFLLAVSDRLKVDESAQGIEAAGNAIFRFKDIPNASEFRARLEERISP